MTLSGGVRVGPFGNVGSHHPGLVTDWLPRAGCFDVSTTDQESGSSHFKGANTTSNTPYNEVDIVCWFASQVTLWDP